MCVGDSAHTGLVVCVYVILYTNKIHLKPLCKETTRLDDLLGHPHRAAWRQQHHSAEKKQRGSRNESRRRRKCLQCGHAGSEGIQNGAGARLFLVFTVRKRRKPSSNWCRGSCTPRSVRHLLPSSASLSAQGMICGSFSRCWTSCALFRSPLLPVSHAQEAYKCKTRLMIWSNLGDLFLCYLFILYIGQKFWKCFLGGNFYWLRESSYELCRVSLTDVWLRAANVNLTARAVQKVRRFVDYTLEI